MLAEIAQIAGSWKYVFLAQQHGARDHGMQAKPSGMKKS
jgi:hypothetical protein